jgi:hypothetical protein
VDVWQPFPTSFQGPKRLFLEVRSSALGGRARQNLSMNAYAYGSPYVWLAFFELPSTLVSRGGCGRLLGCVKWDLEDAAGEGKRPHPGWRMHTLCQKNLFT